ncbi:MAG: DUF1579 domain-containing protein [Gemmataceae bacterium]|nr:DUF1579 domain-containing protein [Gemmataceae bacterium]
MPRRPLVVAVPLAAALLAGPAPSQDKKDPQAKFEPKSQPGAGQKYLEAFVGRWEVTKTFYPRQGDPVAVPGTCEQALVQDGRFLESRFTFRPAGGKPTTGQGLIGFEPETGRFTSVWVDSRQTRMSFRRSEAPFDGKQIVMAGADLGGPPGRGSKTVSRVEDGGEAIVHRQYAVEPGAADRLVMELRLTKKAPPARGPGQ